MSGIVLGAEDTPLNQTLSLSSYILEGKTENACIILNISERGNCCKEKQGTPVTWDTILDRLVNKSSLEDLSMSSELIEIQTVHILRKRVPDRRNSKCRHHGLKTSQLF